MEHFSRFDNSGDECELQSSVGSCRLASYQLHMLTKFVRMDDDDDDDESSTMSENFRLSLILVANTAKTM